MSVSNRCQRWSAIALSTLGGALLGVLLAAFCDGVSGSVTGIVTFLALACGVGWYGNRVTGLLWAAVIGGFVVVFGSLVGGSALGIGLTVGTCAALGGFAQWRHDRVEAESKRLSARAALHLQAPRLAERKSDVLLVKETV